MKSQILLILVTLQFAVAFAQDGKIISQKLHSITEKDRLPLIENFKGADTILENTILEKITYLSDNLKISGYVSKPKYNIKKLPCIIYCRGGNREFGAINSFEQFYLQRMASWGYVVITSKYRGGPESEGKDEFGGSDVNDVMNLLPALAQIQNADTTKVGIHGWSRGGTMVYQALKRTRRFKGAVVGAGTANFYTGISYRKDDFEAKVYAELIPDYYKNKDVELKKRSAVFWADSISKTTPLLIMHGSSDWRVSPDESLELVKKLYDAKHPTKFILYAGGDHGLRAYRRETDAEMRKWFDDYVKNGKALPNMENHGK